MQLKIEKLIYGGKGLGRLEGKATFVPFVIPDEKVQIKIKKEKKNFIEAHLKQVIEKSPYRREPLCNYFTTCGGCDFQHIKYEYQIKLKKDILEEALQRIGNIKSFPEIKTIPSEKEFFYRNRAQFKVYANHIGFYKRESHTVIDIDNCPILSKQIAYIPDKLKELLTYFIVQPKEIHIFSATEGNLLKFIFDKQIKKYPDLKTINKILGINIVGAGIYYRKNQTVYLQKTLGQKFTFEKIKNFKFKVSLDSFFQVNKFQIKNLIDTVISFLKNSKIIADMYCGVGTFSIPAGKIVDKVYGFELNKIAVKDAVENAKINNVKNCKFYPFETKKAVDFLIEKNIPVDTIIFDPPRSGLNKYIIDKTSKIKTLEKIVYVSCNPTTLARDLSDFSKKGFSIKQIYMIDMFPQTYHIETITFLTRNS